MNWNRVIHRYIFALVGGLMAFGGFIFLSFPGKGLIDPARIGSSLSIGLLLGHLTAFAVIVSDDLPRRWRPNHVSIRLLFVLLGLAVSALPWIAYQSLFLYTGINPTIVLIGSASLAFGFVIAPFFSIRNRYIQVLILFSLTTLSLGLGIYLLQQRYVAQLMVGESNAWSLLFFDPARPRITVAGTLWVATMIAGFGHVPAFWLYPQRDA